LTVILLAPALIRAGIEPIAAHMFLFYFGCLSFITPPVCVGAYIAAGISGGDPWKTGFRAVRLGFTAFLVPWAFVFNPGILMIGSPLEILSSFFFIALGAMSIGVAFEGFFINKLSTWLIILFAVSGLCIFIPNILTRVLGIAFLVYFLFKNLAQKRKSKDLLAQAHRAGHPINE
jgi:TRAP-type uncharacterized transport system fused permease subunit